MWKKGGKIVGYISQMISVGSLSSPLFLAPDTLTLECDGPNQPCDLILLITAASGQVKEGGLEFHNRSFELLERGISH